MAQIPRQKYDIFPNPVLSTVPGRIFHAVAAISGILSNTIIFLPHSWATFGTKCKEILEERGASGINILNPLWSYPWLSGAVLQCPSLFTFFHAFAAIVLVFFVLISFFSRLSGNFWYQIQEQTSKNTLYWTLSQWNYHAGTAPGRVGQCCSALSSCIICACSCS